MTVLIAILAGALGLVAGFFVRTLILKQAEQKRAAEAQQLIREAEEKAAKLLEDVRTEDKARRAELALEKQRVDKREEMYTQKLLELQNKAQDLNAKALKVEEIKQAVEQIKSEQVAKLQEVAGLKREEALAQLMQRVEEHSKEALLSRMRKLEFRNDEEVAQKAKDIIALAVMRFASAQAVETTTTTIHLPADDIKGRIIGKEGRNIKALELITGCEIIVDDTPGIVTVSGFSPIRRHITKRSLDKLIQDGRIHPGRIEEMVEESKRELAQEMTKAGEDALLELGIPVSSIDPKLIQILGRLKFRTSYGQNALQHSIEVARLAGMMAEDLGANVFVCKKGGLFHDIGKAVDHDMQGSHPEIGINIMRKFGFPEEIVYQSIGHHVDKPASLEAIVVKAADAISGARPGARKNSLENYVQRMEDLEAVATRHEAVDRAYAIQAGREIRVFIHPHKMDDYGAAQLARDIAAQVEAELQYPGEVKVTVIRESRVHEFAR